MKFLSSEGSMGYLVMSATHVLLAFWDYGARVTLGKNIFYFHFMSLEYCCHFICDFEALQTVSNYSISFTNLEIRNFGMRSFRLLILN